MPNTLQPQKSDTCHQSGTTDMTIYSVLRYGFLHSETPTTNQTIDQEENLTMDTQKLLLKEKMLKLELQLVQAQLEFVRADCSEQQGSRSNRETSFSKEAYVTSGHISMPYLPADFFKGKFIPELTASGKESSNPLMAINLPKVEKEVQISVLAVLSSTSGEKDKVVALSKSKNTVQTVMAGPTEVPAKPLSLRPNLGLGVHGKNYYVVFNGPYSGIYRSWEIAKKATKGIPGIPHKKYKSLELARAAAHVFCFENKVEDL